MATYDLRLESFQWGGTTSVELNTGVPGEKFVFTVRTNGTIQLVGNPGEVKVSILSVAKDKVVVVRNGADGTPFVFEFGVETDQKQISVLINNSQGGGATSYVRLTCDGVDSVDHNSAGSAPYVLRLA